MYPRILLGIVAISLFVWLVVGLSNHAANVADRLDREIAKNIDIVNSQLAEQTISVSLTDQLTAKRYVDSDTWTIDSPSIARVETPYRPDVGPEPTSGQSPPRNSNPGFVGAAACAECHSQKHAGFVNTSHHKTSAIVSSGSFNGPLGDASTVVTDDPQVTHKVVKNGQGYFQSLDFYGWQHTAPMQIATGSAKAGQTYLYWHGDGLFQTHLAYASNADQWIPSPGFTATDVVLTRPVTTGCLECHMTYIQETKPPNFYHQDSAVWGISCERCHGPGRDHIQYHHANPQATDTKFVAQPANLQRQQQLDICSQCHSGLFKIKQAAFSFRPGDKLTDHHQTQSPHDQVGSVHTSNQLSRLEQSACFQQTTMTCTTCHNPHRHERGDTSLFSKSCLKCHQPEHCGMSGELGAPITSDCISCHMPMTEDKDMPLKTRRGTLFPAMADHYIRVDRAATKNFLQQRP